MSQRIPPRDPPVPGPLGEDDAAREARIRLKFDIGGPLRPDERGFLARLPAGRETTPGEVQEAAARKGGVEPIDAATGEPHVAKRP